MITEAFITVLNMKSLDAVLRTEALKLLEQLQQAEHLSGEALIQLRTEGNVTLHTALSLIQRMHYLQSEVMWPGTSIKPLPVESADQILDTVCMALIHEQEYERIMRSMSTVETPTKH